MLVIKYKKTDSAKFISHLDMLRQFLRMLRRSDVSVQQSNGFNPHELVYFAPPTPTGVNSVADYCTVVTSREKQGLLEVLNQNAQQGIEVLEIFEAVKNPNLANKVTYAEYEMPYDSMLEEKLKEIFEKDSFFIKFEKKGEEVLQDVRPLMKSYWVSGDKIYFVCGCGEKTLRIDRFMLNIGLVDWTKIVRTRLFMGDRDNLVDVDSLL